ncbi:MAG TPA: hypothetical protein VMW42_06425 [Desulfatiglandales bacterium]|nr:hypothetical protein [Desulfatiglandales bacterium]
MERKIKESDEKRNKLIAMVEDYVQGKCRAIMLVAHNEQGVILDIPLKGLPNFANEKLLMTELLEAHMVRRISMGLEHKIKAIVGGSQKAVEGFVRSEIQNMCAGAGNKKEDKK